MYIDAEVFSHVNDLTAVGTCRNCSVLNSFKMKSVRKSSDIRFHFLKAKYISNCLKKTQTNFPWEREKISFKVRRTCATLTQAKFH